MEEQQEEKKQIDNVDNVDDSSVQANQGSVVNVNLDEPKKQASKPKVLTHKQKMKQWKKNAKYLPKWAKNRNLKKDLTLSFNQSNNYVNDFNNFFKGDKFKHNQLMNYSKAIRKLRKNKKTPKRKKVAMTHQIQFMNLLFNTDRKLHSQPTFNLMKTTPKNYLSFFDKTDINQVWKATGLPYSSTKNIIIKDLNKAYMSFLKHDLIFGKRHVPLKNKKQQNQNDDDIDIVNDEKNKN